MNSESFWAETIEILKLIGINLAKLIAIFILGFIAIKIVLKVLKAIFSKSNLDPTASKFILKITKFALYFILIIAMSQVIGIPTTGFIAVLSAAGLALSLAMQDSLSNLANGLVLISTKPFSEGDFVKIDEDEGSVYEIKMLHTILKTVDNKLISMPNKTVVASSIINYNKLQTRRVIINFKVGYKTDISKAIKIINNVYNSSNLILSEPNPFVTLDSLDLEGLSIYTSCWCESKDYWTAYYYVLNNVFNEFKKEKISQPHVAFLSDENELPFENISLPKQAPKKKVSAAKEDKDILDDIFDTITGKKLIKKAKSKKSKNKTEE